MRDRRFKAELSSVILSLSSLVPKLYLGTGLSAQLHCGYRSGIGDGIASASAFPNGVWERGEVAQAVG